LRLMASPAGSPDRLKKKNPPVFYCGMLRRRHEGDRGGPSSAESPACTHRSRLVDNVVSNLLGARAARIFVRHPSNLMCAKRDRSRCIIGGLNEATPKRPNSASALRPMEPGLYPWSPNCHSPPFFFFFFVCRWRGAPKASAPGRSIVNLEHFGFWEVRTVTSGWR